MSTGANFTVIRYTIELQSPVLATDVMGEPNSAVSMPYISGSLLRGALIARYLQNSQANFDPAENAEARRLFFSDSTRFLNAYPMNPNLGRTEKRRALPMPLAWRFDKEDYFNEMIHDLSRKSADFRDEAVGSAFFWRDKKEEIGRFSPPRKINVHTQRDARKGRSTEESGAVYRYDGLASGMRLQALILTTMETRERIEKLLDGATLWIGRARRAGYGKSVITEVESLEFWRESGTDDSPSSLDVDDILHITFTSDALLRDENGQATLDPRFALETAMELPAGSLIPQPDLSWASSKIVGGFNRKWGLPLPQTIALAAGSVFVYQTKTPVDWQKLSDLERNGIGERRNEGFGQMLVNWLDGENKEFSSHYEPEITPKSALTPLSSEEEKQAKLIADRILRRRLDEKLLQKTNHTRLLLQEPKHTRLLKGSSLNKNQLARLRVILRSIRTGRDQGHPDIERLKQYLDSVQERRSARDQFARTRVDENGERSDLLKWIKEQLAILEEKPDEEEEERAKRQRELIKRMIGKWNVASVTLGEGTVVIHAAVGEEISREYALRFVDQVLYRATKDQRPEGGN